MHVRRKLLGRFMRSFLNFYLQCVREFSIYYRDPSPRSFTNTWRLATANPLLKTPARCVLRNPISAYPHPKISISHFGWSESLCRVDDKICFAESLRENRTGFPSSSFGPVIGSAPSHQRTYRESVLIALENEVFYNFSWNLIEISHRGFGRFSGAKCLHNACHWLFTKTTPKKGFFCFGGSYMDAGTKRILAINLGSSWLSRHAPLLKMLGDLLSSIRFGRFECRMFAL